MQHIFMNLGICHLSRFENCRLEGLETMQALSAYPRATLYTAKSEFSVEFIPEEGSTHITFKIRNDIIIESLIGWKIDLHNRWLRYVCHYRDLHQKCLAPGVPAFGQPTLLPWCATIAHRSYGSLPFGEPETLSEIEETLAWVIVRKQGVLTN